VKTTEEFRKRNIGLAPTTALGRYSVAVFGVVIAVVTFRIAMDAASTGPDSAWMTGFGIAAFAGVTGATAIGVIAMLRERDRSAAVFVTVVVGLAVLVAELVERLSS
jgi:hypothetical protein